ncbi:MAG TPA: ribonuclease R [Candidatus Polarisedimenticolaceae bacterium]
MTRRLDREAAAAALLAYVQSESYRPLSLREILRRIDVAREDRPEIRRAAKDLLQDGRIAKTRDNRLIPSTSGGLVRGRLQMHRDGYGFVVPEDGSPDLFIPPKRTAGGMGGDVVAARIVREGPKGEREGEVVSILDRRSRRVVGLFRERDRAGIVVSFDPTNPLDVHIPGAFRMGAKDGEAVTVEVLRGTSPWGRAEGKVLEVLGRPDAPGVDTEIVARRHGLSMAFADETLEASQALPDAVPREESERRERFDDPAPVTIDGETARDFDDAIAVQELHGGAFRLFVHIADVAWFVAPGDPLDREARARGTSVYFPDRVLPMFPEALSNDLCSLRPLEDRLVQSAVLDFDPQGEPAGVRFADGVIRSAARLTYGQVGEFLDSGRRSAAIPAKVAPMLLAADRLRVLLEARRRARGSVDFDLPEPKILLDVEGAMTGIRIEERNRAHRMIEEFMLAANEAVAGLLERHEAPCLYRVHEAPDPLKVDTLREFASGFGIDWKVDPERVRPRDLQRLVDAAAGRPEERLVASVALRSMKQARYTAANTGHFGLAAPVYAHFTSPIRRYPDLVVHRALRALRHRRRAALAQLAADLEKLGEDCSRLERAAEAAEREVLEWKKIAFLAGREGEAFDGVVTGVARFGLFVQLTESLVDGLVRAESLGDDRFEYVESRQELRGSRSGAAFRLGDPLRVVVAKVDTVLRRVDLVPESQATAPRAPRPPRARKVVPARAARPPGKGPRKGRRRR